MNKKVIYDRDEAALIRNMIQPGGIGHGAKHLQITTNLIKVSTGDKYMRAYL